MALLEFTSNISNVGNFSRSSDFVYAGFVALVTLTSLLLNPTLMYWYHYRVGVSLSSRLYFWMATFDLLAMILKPAFILKLTLQKEPVDYMLLEPKVPAVVVLVVSSMMRVLSSLMIGDLSIVRYVKIRKPFYRLKWKWVQIHAVITTLIFALTFFAMIVIKGHKIYFNVCALLIVSGSEEKKGFYSSSVLVYTMPQIGYIFISTVTSILTIYELKTNNMSQSANSRKKGTITILLLNAYNTAFGIITTSFFVRTSLRSERQTLGSLILVADIMETENNFCFDLFVVISLSMMPSLVNPLLVLGSNSSLRSWLKSVLFCRRPVGATSSYSNTAPPAVKPSHRDKNNTFK